MKSRLTTPVLCTLKTREGHRKRGAGGMLVKWGADKAREAGVPAFLEASRAGQPLYEKFGFKKIGEQKLQLQQFGFPEPVVLARMAANV